MFLSSLFKRAPRPSFGTVYSCRDVSYLEDDGPKMKKLYGRVIDLFEEKKPYLDGNFSIGDLAQKLFCNRTYLSRTINICSGHNFRGLVNAYRVKYAAHLMKQDPIMKIEEVARMSGFNTLPTFNSSFKLIMHVRPSEYLSEVRRQFRKSLSTTPAQKQ